MVSNELKTIKFCSTFKHCRTNQNFNNKHFHKYHIHIIYYTYKVAAHLIVHTTFYNNNKVVLIYSKVKQYVFSKTNIQNR